MNKSESITNITAAIIAVMKDVKGIEKNMTVGEGTKGEYPGVADQDVKKIIGESMANNGLSILPTSITPKTQVDRWEGQYGPKQSVFTEVTTTYILMHTSGEWIEVSGYGHGVDSQDKGAGKAATYALKYTLLYLFLVPTGKIDDADKVHSDKIEVPAKTTMHNHKELGTAEKPLVPNAEFKKLCEAAKAGKLGVLQDAKQKYTFEKTQTSLLNQLYKESQTVTV